MTSRPDQDPEIAAWLHDEAPVRAPEHLLTSSRARIQSTKQRRPWWPARRSPDMNSQIRLVGTLAAIAVVVAVLGVVLIPSVGGLGGPPTPSATPTPSASPSPPASSTPSPSPSSSLAVISPGQVCSATACQTGALEAGTYSFAAVHSPRERLRPLCSPSPFRQDGRPTRGTFARTPSRPTKDVGNLGPNELFFATCPDRPTSSPTPAIRTRRWSAPGRPSTS